MTKIIRCKCANDYQDSIYGKFNRVHNYSKKNKRWHCTVCGDRKAE